MFPPPLLRESDEGRRATIRTLGGAFLLTHAPRPRAQAWPDGPLKIVVPFTAGGIADLIAREVAARLSPALGQPVLVDNRTGASGSIGTEAVARAVPDGRTLLISSGATTISAAIKPDLSWHPVRSFAPIGMVATSPQVLLVHPGVPARTLQEFIAQARAQPGKIAFGSVGVGSTPHLTIELLKAAVGIDLVHVPYRGQPEVLNDLVQGNVVLSSVTVSLAMPRIRAGQLRPLAVTTLRRSVLLPDVPTVVESGVQPFDVPNWFGLSVTRGTPEPALARLRDDLQRAMASPELADRLSKLGVDAHPMSPAEFERFVEADLVRWTEVVRRAGIAAQ